LKVWDLASKRAVRSYDDHTGLVYTVAFHPDGTCIASAGKQEDSILMERALHWQEDRGHA
jgi:centriolar protein POC1